MPFGFFCVPKAPGSEQVTGPDQLFVELLVLLHLQTLLSNCFIFKDVKVNNTETFLRFK